VLGRIRLVLVAERAGAPMRTCERVETVAGKGIVGDRYYTGLGHWSDPRWPDQEITLVEEETALRLGVAAQSLRRNIVTQGIELAALIGKRFRLGEGGPVLLGVRPCDPCAYIEGFTRPGMLRELSEGGAGGLRASILADGWLAAGAAIVLVEEDP
jgi:hypothetical protein